METISTKDPKAPLKTADPEKVLKKQRERVRNQREIIKAIKLAGFI